MSKTFNNIFIFFSIDMNVWNLVPVICLAELQKLIYSL